MKADPFENRARARDLFDSLLSHLNAVGPLETETKKTSVHVVVPGKPAFLGVHPKKDHLQLNIVGSQPLEGSRVIKSEMVSANRYHNLVKLEAEEGIDEELMGWLGTAYRRIADK